ncbi:MAG: hypothetical protein KF851_01310 [Pirellulaceae bacterium]|nr:hypothetical protein [Pirellulaceae bacterium]
MCYDSATECYFFATFLRSRIYALANNTTQGMIDHRLSSITKVFEVFVFGQCVDSHGDRWGIA